jgi:hypothetical protein
MDRHRLNLGANTGLGWNGHDARPAERALHFGKTGCARRVAFRRGSASVTSARLAFPARSRSQTRSVATS